MSARDRWATARQRSDFLKAIKARDGSLTCHWCGASPRRSVDHVVSRSNGGPSELWNLVASCHECNAARGNRDDPTHCEFCRLAHVRVAGRFADAIRSMSTATTKEAPDA